MRIVVGLVVLLGITEVAAQEAGSWRGRISELLVTRDGAVAMKLDGKAQLSVSCPDQSHFGYEGPFAGLEPGDLDDPKVIDMMLETARLSMASRKEIELTIDGCSENGSWYRVKSIYVEG